MEKYSNLTKEQLIDLAEQEKKLYYSTKQMTNRVRNHDTILSLWSVADKHWENYQNITKEISLRT